MARADRLSLSPAALASVAVHGAVLTALVMFAPRVVSHPVRIANSVPVRLVPIGPVDDVRAAIAGPVTKTEPEPEPEPVIEPRPDPAPAAAPAPTPRPLPPKLAPPKPAVIQPRSAPAPTPVPVPRPVTAAPRPAKPVPAPARPTASQPGLDLDALARSLAKGAAKPREARPGRPGAETAPVERQAVGPGRKLSQLEVADLSAPLERLWNPNCEVEGGANVDLTVAATLGPDGRLIGPPQVTQGLGDDAITQAAAIRAQSAFRRAEPFKVPPDFGTQRINFKFNARSACGSR